MFVRQLFNAGRQLLGPKILGSTIAQRCNSFQNTQKIEFLRTPTIQQNTCQSVVNDVNGLVKRNVEGRLFAVVHLCGKQYKVTAGDVIVIEGYWAPTTGDQIRLEKVLLAGSDSFTLTGRPLVQPNLVDVQATVVEKTIAHTRTTFKKKKRKQYMRIKFHRSAQSMIRINSITVNSQINMKSNRGSELLSK